MQPSNDLLKVVRENKNSILWFMSRTRHFTVYSGIHADTDPRKFYTDDGTYYDIQGTRSDGAIAYPMDNGRGWHTDEPDGKRPDDLVAIFKDLPLGNQNAVCLALIEGYKPNDKV